MSIDETDPVRRVPVGDEDPIPWARLRGDDDAVPWNLKSDNTHPVKWEPGIGTYYAYQIGSFIDLIATGMTTHSNTEVKLVRSAIAVFPPEYILMFSSPEFALPAAKPFTVTASFLSKQSIGKLIVWDKEGKHEVAVTQSPQ